MSTITKRPGYSVMRETPEAEKGRELAKMIKTNPKAMRYFMRRNIFVRAGEISKMVISTEAHNRKEALRSSLYNLAEPHLKDSKARDVNIEGAVKGALEAAKGEIMSKPVRTEEDMASLKVIDEMLNKNREIDSSKILKDKEKWWRRILRFLTAAALGAALMLPFMHKGGEEEKPPIVVEKKVEDPELRKSLDMCLDALSNSKCPPQNVIYKTVLKEVIDDKCCSKRDQLQEELNGCKDNNLKLNTDLQELEKLKSKEKYYAFKLELMNKVDRIFDGIGVKPKNGGRGPEDELYKKTIRPWFEKGIMNDDPVMIILVINMGGELLGQEIKDGKVVRLKQPISNKEFNELFENVNLAYLDGVSLDNNAGNRKDGMKNAAFMYYKYKYKLIEEALKNSP